MQFIKLNNFCYLVDIKHKDELKIGMQFQGFVLTNTEEKDKYLILFVSSTRYFI